MKKDCVKEFNGVEEFEEWVESEYRVANLKVIQGETRIMSCGDDYEVITEMKPCPTFHLTDELFISLDVSVYFTKDAGTSRIYVIADILSTHGSIIVGNTQVDMSGVHLNLDEVQTDDLDHWVSIEEIEEVLTTFLKEVIANMFMNKSTDIKLKAE